MPDKIILTDLPINYGKIMTLKNFSRDCANALLTDYDGHGRYVAEFNGKQMMTDIYVHPSDILDGDIKKEYNLVIWFNK
jgi:hypothetical protein